MPEKLTRIVLSLTTLFWGISCIAQNTGFMGKKFMLGAEGRIGGDPVSATIVSTLPGEELDAKLMLYSYLNLKAEIATGRRTTLGVNFSKTSPHFPVSVRKIELGSSGPTYHIEHERKEMQSDIFMAAFTWKRFREGKFRSVAPVGIYVQQEIGIQKFKLTDVEGVLGIKEKVYLNETYGYYGLGFGKQQVIAGGLMLDIGLNMIFSSGLLVEDEEMQHQVVGDNSYEYWWKTGGFLFIHSGFKGKIGLSYLIF